VKHPTDNDDPGDVAELSREVAKDLAEGNGGKHFEREIDELHSIQRNTATPDPDVAARLHRFCLQFRAGLNDQLRPAGLHCVYVLPDGRGEGFAIRFVDKERRIFDVEYSFDEGMAAAARTAETDVGREWLHEVARKVTNARAVYFARMC
jgi:hypothetical protein